jgi:hypothetical protein
VTQKSQGPSAPFTGTAWLFWRWPLGAMREGVGEEVGDGGGIGFHPPVTSRRRREEPVGQFTASSIEDYLIPTPYSNDLSLGVMGTVTIPYHLHRPKHWSPLPPLAAPATKGRGPRSSIL